MAENESTDAGTPEAEGGDAAQPTTAAPATDDRNESGEAEKTIAVPEREFASWKTKVERTNELEAELERIRQERTATPAAASAEDAQAKIDALVAEAEEFASGRKGQPDPVAALILTERAERLAFQKQQMLAGQLLQVPEGTQRKAVYDEYMRGGYADVNQARTKVERDALEARTKDLEAQLAAAKKKPEVNPGVPTSRESPTAPTKPEQTMTKADWDREQATLSDDERMNRQIARRAGKIVVQ